VRAAELFTKAVAFAAWLGWYQYLKAKLRRDFDECDKGCTATYVAAAVATVLSVLVVYSLVYAHKVLLEALQRRTRDSEVRTVSPSDKSPLLTVRVFSKTVDLISDTLPFLFVEFWYDVINDNRPDYDHQTDDNQLYWAWHWIFFIVFSAVAAFTLGILGTLTPNEPTIKQAAFKKAGKSVTAAFAWFCAMALYAAFLSLLEKVHTEGDGDLKLSELNWIVFAAGTALALSLLAPAPSEKRIDILQHPENEGEAETSEAAEQSVIEAIGGFVMSAGRDVLGLHFQLVAKAAVYTAALAFSSAVTLSIFEGSDYGGLDDIRRKLIVRAVLSTIFGAIFIVLLQFILGTTKRPPQAAAAGGVTVDTEGAVAEVQRIRRAILGEILTIITTGIGFITGDAWVEAFRFRKEMEDEDEWLVFAVVMTIAAVVSEFLWAQYVLGAVQGLFREMRSRWDGYAHGRREQTEMAETAPQVIGSGDDVKPPSYGDDPNQPPTYTSDPVLL